MDSMIKIFENEKFGKIRTLIINGDPWFILADICKVLEISNSRMVGGRLDEDELMSVRLTSGGQRREMTAVSESGLYDVILRSDKPQAKPFRKWVTTEILPTIRRTGGYVGNEDMFVESYLPFADDAVKNLFRLNLMTIRQLNEKIRRDEPLVQFANQVADTENVIDIGKMAKLANEENIRIGRNTLFRWLKGRKILMSNNIPYQQFIDRGYFVVKESVYEQHGMQKTYQQTYVTGKGQQYIIRLLKEYFGEGC